MASWCLQPLQRTSNLAQNASDRSLELKLTQAFRFRQLIPEWVYDEVQRDAAEYTQHLLQAQQLLTAQWDCRRFGLAGLQLRAQGDLPIPMPLPREARDFKKVIHHWNTHSDVHALAHPSPCLCLQLNRYLRHGRADKLQTPIRFNRPVYFPRFEAHIRITWDRYEVSAAVIHLGRSTQSGHYRALLKVGAQWMYTDDSRYAQPIELDDTIASNVYLLWLKRC